MPKTSIVDRKRIGTLEVAAKGGWHPMSVPKFVKSKKDFPRPVKIFGKNYFYEDEIDAYIEKLLRGGSAA